MDLLLPPSEPPAVRLSSNQDVDLQACFQLRYGYFVEQRGWVGANPHEPGIERDAYDDYALHLEVSDGKGIAAYLRMLPFRPETGFMLDHELSCILSDEAHQNLLRDDAVELSRFVVRSNLESCPFTQIHPVERLFKRFYQESKTRGFWRFYIVVEPSWIRLFARRFGVVFRIIGQPYTFPDGTKTVAATATLQELEEGIRRRSMAKWAWYEQEKS
jgi:N-acyl-L-homoserine lactone synthetase